MCPALQPPIQLFFQDLSVDIRAAFIRLSHRAPRLVTVGSLQGRTAENRWLWVNFRSVSQQVYAFFSHSSHGLSPHLHSWTQRAGFLWTGDHQLQSLQVETERLDGCPAPHGSVTVINDFMHVWQIFNASKSILKANCKLIYRLTMASPISQ